MNHIDRYIGCNTELPRMFKSWSTTDLLMKQLDSKFCSKDCGCKMNEYVQFMYKSDPIERQEYNNFNVTDQGYDKATDCPDSDAIIDSWANEETGYMVGVYEEYFSSKKFKKYWKKLEEKFDCSGFCVNNYYMDESNQKPRTINKFLFSGINRGIPKYKGCMWRVMKWLKEMLLSFGILALLTGVIEMLIVACCCFINAYNKSCQRIKIKTGS